jgi:hypothetical protein
MYSYKKSAWPLLPVVLHTSTTYFEAALSIIIQ